MDQHLAHGDQLDRRSRLPHDRCYLLRAGRFQGPAIPGQQDFGWTGRGTDDYLSVEVKEVQFQGWWENESKTGTSGSKTACGCPNVAHWKYPGLAA
jgi:hypothetical protein